MKLPTTVCRIVPWSLAIGLTVLTLATVGVDIYSHLYGKFKGYIELTVTEGGYPVQPILVPYWLLVGLLSTSTGFAWVWLHYSRTTCRPARP